MHSTDGQNLMESIPTSSIIKEDTSNRLWSCTMESICLQTHGSTRMTQLILVCLYRSSFGKLATMCGWSTIAVSVIVRAMYRLTHWVTLTNTGTSPSLRSVYLMCQLPLAKWRKLLKPTTFWTSFTTTLIKWSTLAMIRAQMQSCTA